MVPRAYWSQWGAPRPVNAGHHIAAVGVRAPCAAIYSESAARLEQLAAHPAATGWRHRPRKWSPPARNSPCRPGPRQWWSPARFGRTPACSPVFISMKAAGAVGVFGLARGKAGLAEERRLLVARRARDWDAAARSAWGRLTRKSSWRAWAPAACSRGYPAAARISSSQLQGVDVEQHGAARRWSSR